MSDRNRYTFDQLCRTTAIRRAAELGIVETGALLSINSSPNAIYEPLRCISSSLAAACRFGIPNDSLMFEITETEQLIEPAHLKPIFAAYASLGFKVILNDFGAGFANFDVLADFIPDIVKLDMKLLRDIDRDRKRQIVVRNITRMFRELGVVIIAEGIETVGEFDAIKELGVSLFQGYLFAKAQFDAFAAIGRMM